MYVFITYIQTFFDTLEQQYAIKQIAVRLPSQKYSGPKIAHNLNLTPQCLIYYIRLDGCNNCNKPQRDTLKIALGIKLFCLWSQLAENFFCNVIRV